MFLNFFYLYLFVWIIYILVVSCLKDDEYFFRILGY